MREGPAGLVAEDVGEVLQADLDLLGGLIVVGEVGGVAPCLLFWRGQVRGEGCCGRLRCAAARTRRRLYSFSKRRRRLTGSFADSRRELSAKGVFAIRRDHWRTVSAQAQSTRGGGPETETYEVHVVSRGMPMLRRARNL